MRAFRSLILSVLLSISFSTASAVENKEYILGTATTGGVFYPVGVALSTLSKVKIQPENHFSITAISSGGSDENIRLMADGQAQFGILQSLYGYYAWTGTGLMQKAGKQKNLRAVTMLWQNVEHFLLNEDFVKTGNISDFAGVKGQRMAFGPRNSGTIGSNEVLLKGLGLNLNQDYTLMYGGYGPSADALQNKQAVGAGLPTGIPAGALTKMFASIGKQIRILNITDEQLQKMDAGKHIWSRYTIAENTYPHQDYTVQTIAQPNFLAVNADVSEEDVYALTKAIYENLPFLQGIHAATKDMSLEKAIIGLPLPLHPGAARYYREQGIQIPDNLR